MSREKQKLVIIDANGDQIAESEVGEQKVAITGLKAGSTIAAGAYKVAYRAENGAVSASVDVPAFDVLAATTTTTSTTTVKPTTTTTTTTSTTTKAPTTTTTTSTTTKAAAGE